MQIRGQTAGSVRSRSALSSKAASFGSSAVRVKGHFGSNLPMLSRKMENALTNGQGWVSLVWSTGHCPKCPTRVSTLWPISARIHLSSKMGGFVTAMTIYLRLMWSMGMHQEGALHFVNPITVYLICQFQAPLIQQQIRIWCQKYGQINGDTIIWFSRKHSGKRRNCSLWAISSFPTMFSKVICRWCVKMSINAVVG